MNAWEAPVRPSWLTTDIEQELIKWNCPINQDGMLLLWDKQKKALEHYKEKEMEYRKICAVLLVPAKTEGTTNVELGEGYKAKVVNKFNYTLDSDNDKVWAGLDKISNLGNEGKFVAERLVSWTPNFLLTEYRQLQEDAEKGSDFAKRALEVITEFMTIKEAAPTVEIKEPKVKK